MRGHTPQDVRDAYRELEHIRADYPFSADVIKKVMPKRPEPPTLGDLYDLIADFIGRYVIDQKAVDEVAKENANEIVDTLNAIIADQDEEACVEIDVPDHPETPPPCWPPCARITEEESDA